MIFLYSFLIGGLICAIGQILIDKLKFLPIHVTSLYVFLGGLFDIFGLYDKLVEFAGCGATIPISSFGHSLVHSAMEKAEEMGVIGIFVGIFDKTASGITAAIVFAFFVAIIFKPKG